MLSKHKRTHVIMFKINQTLKIKQIRVIKTTEYLLIKVNSKINTSRLILLKIALKVKLLLVTIMFFLADISGWGHRLKIIKKILIKMIVRIVRKFKT